MRGECVGLLQGGLKEEAQMVPGGEQRRGHHAKWWLSGSVCYLWGAKEIGLNYAKVICLCDGKKSACPLWSSSPGQTLQSKIEILRKYKTQQSSHRDKML